MDGSILMPTFFAGLAFGALSLVSIGPNNILLLREGLFGSRPGLVAGVMWLSYASLLGAAVYGGQAIGPLIGGLAPLLTWGGAIILIGMGMASFRLSTTPLQSLTGRACARESSMAATCRVLRVVWLNPLTYLELLAIPAALALPFAGLDQRTALYAGLLLAFTLNCFGFSFGASILSPMFATSSHMRLFDRVAGGLMIVLALITATQAAMPPSLHHLTQP